MPKSLPVVDISTPICCAPVAAEVISDSGALDLALRLKSLADPVRVKIVSLLLAADDGGYRNLDLVGALDLSDATVSHHLRQLQRAGLLTKEQIGKSVYYRVNRESLSALARIFDPSCC